MNINGNKSMPIIAFSTLNDAMNSNFNGCEFVILVMGEDSVNDGKGGFYYVTKKDNTGENIKGISKVDSNIKFVPVRVNS